VEYAISGTIQASRGDFRFFDDRGTPYNLADDGFARRINNDGFLLAVLGWVRVKLRKHVTLSLLESLSLKEKGVPGPGYAQAQGPRSWALHQVLDAKLDHRRFLHRNLSAMIRLNVQVTEDRFRDPDSELGIGVQDQRDRAVTAGLVGRLSWAPHAPQLLSLVPEWRLETYAGRDPAADRAGLGHLPRSQRYRFALALRDQIVLWKERLSLTPALRLDALYTDVSGTTTGGDPLRNVHEQFLSPRLGVKLRLARGVSLRGNAGRYFRPPTVLELFGDRGTSIGNPELTSETGWGGDAGVVIDLRRRKRWLPRLLLEAAGFGREASDLIQWMQNSQRTAQARNVARARAAGVEAVLGAWLRLHRRVSARLTASYTFLHTENLSGQPLIDGKRLPGRPAHELDARADLSVRWRRLRVAVHYALSLATDSYLDEANLFLPVPRRALHDVGVILDPGVPGLTVAVTLRNLADARIERQAAPAFTGLSTVPRPLQDYGGYPLPGRSFLVTLSWTH
jgi:iron complex outermembrane receptor protein